MPSRRAPSASMGYRVANQSSLAFRTDLPPSSRHIHPSGVLHASRPSRPGGGGPDEEHAFAWVEDALHVEAALSLLEGRGFRRSHSVVFVPYSSRRNWLRRYPHAAPALVCGEDGTCAVHPSAAAEGDDEDDGAGNEEEKKEIADDDVDVADAAAAADAAEKRARRKHKARAVSNMFNDRNFIPDAERDELHVEIYNYLAWLHAKLTELEERAEAAELEKRTASMIPTDDADGDDKGHEGGGGKKMRKGSRRSKGAGVNLAELQGVIDKMESAFLIIPNAKEEAAAEIAAAEAAAAAEETGQEQDGEQERGNGDGASEEQQQSDEQQEGEQEHREEEATSGERQKSDDAAGEQRKTQQPPEASATNNSPNVESPPFLERHCSEALFQKVLTREGSGRPRRRSRKRRREESANPCWKVEGFDEMFDKLLRYREEHGHVAVPRNPRKKNDENRKLANWVNALRERRRILLRSSGREHEPPVPGKRGGLLTKTLTLERVERLDSVGFVWSVAGPKAAWEDRFREAVEYFEANGRWPPHGLGKLGEWVHKQRVAYARGDASFLRDKAPKLNEVGFEWSPRGPRGRR